MPLNINANLRSACLEDPLANLSTESEDVDRFIGIEWPVPPIPPTCLATGKCGHIYFAWGCMGLCFSVTSQEDADQCAINQALECIGDDKGCVDNCGDDNGGGGGNLFASDSQTCSVACSNGGTFTYFLPAGAALSFFSKADANARAKGLCNKLAGQFKLCLVIKGSTTSCRDDYTSFLIQATGRLSQSPLSSFWTISGPVIDVNVLGYDSSNAAIFGTQEMRIFGTPTIATTTYIIARITDANTGVYMERTIPVTIEPCDDGEYGNITPNIDKATPVYWNSDASIPAGTYRVAYVTGAWFGPGVPSGWLVNDNGFMPDGHTPRGFYVKYSGGQIHFPVAGLFPTQAQAEAGNGGLSLTFTHTGGLIGMYQLDSAYGDNQPGSPNPTFKLEPI